MRLLHSWQERVLNTNCDVLTLLVGINDTNTLFDEDKNEWQKYNASPRAYEQNLRYMLYLARQKNPRLKIILGIPFYCRVDKLINYSSVKHDADEKKFTLKIRRYSQFKWEEKLVDVQKKQEAAKRIARDFGAYLLDFPALIDKALKKAPAEYWIWDGVHPTTSFHMLMYKEWLNVCRTNGIIPE